jgi:hypothetical protein
MVIGETEGVAAVQPAVVGVATLRGFANGGFHDGWMFPRIRRDGQCHLHPKFMCRAYEVVYE